MNKCEEDDCRELSLEMRIPVSEMEEILQENHCFYASGTHTKKQPHKSLKEMFTMSDTAMVSEKDKLWTKDYIFDVGVNFLVYCVHFLLMLWSTAYAINKWDASISEAGLASGLFIVGALAARIPAGRFIDFIGRRKVFLCGTAFFFLLILLYENVPTLGLFMAVRFLHGLSFGSTSTASSTIVAALIPLHRMGTGIGYFTLGVTVASAVGPFIAMNLVAAQAFSLCIDICLVAALCIFLLSFGINPPERVILPEEKSHLTSLAWDNFFSIKALAISCVALLGGICYSTVLSFLGAYTNSIGVTGIGATCFFLFFAAASFVSRPLTGYLLDHYGGNVVIYPALISMAVAMGFMANAASDIPLLIGALFLGYGYGTVTAACHALAVHCAPMHQAGIATSTYFVLLDLGIGVGPYTLGSFVPAMGFSFVYLAAGVLAMCGIGIYYILLARHDRFTRHQMDRDSKAKTIIENRRHEFYERKLAHAAE